MYTIGNVIIGTHLPWDYEKFKKIAMAYVNDDPVSLLQQGETLEDLMIAAEQGELDFVEVFDDVWNHEYHGSADSPVAWVGVQYATIDESDHVDLRKLMEMSPNPEQLSEAGRRYNSLPEDVRNLLPPFGKYIVWSTS